MLVQLAIGHADNIPSVQFLTAISRKYFVKILYAIIDAIDRVCLEIPKLCIVGYSLTCPIKSSELIVEAVSSVSQFPMRSFLLNLAKENTGD